MRGIVTNEFDILEETLNGEIKNVSNSRNVLVKKCIKEGKGLDETLAFVNDFFKRHVGNYKVSTNKAIIIKCYNEHKYNSDYIYIDKIPVTENEWISITSLNDTILEKTLLVFLVYEKAYQLIHPECNGWININEKYIFKEVKSNHKLLKYEEWNRMTCELYRLDYLGQKNGCNNLSVHINYLSTNEDDNVKFEVEDLDNIVSYYDEYKNGTQYVDCEKCGKRIKKGKNNTRKYCNRCAKLVKIQQNTSC